MREKQRSKGWITTKASLLALAHPSQATACSCFPLPFSPSPPSSILLLLLHVAISRLGCRSEDYSVEVNIGSKSGTNQKGNLRMKEKQQEQEVEKLDPNNHLAPLAIAEQQQQLKPFQPPWTPSSRDASPSGQKIATNMTRSF